MLRRVYRTILTIGARHCIIYIERNNCLIFINLRQSQILFWQLNKVKALQENRMLYNNIPVIERNITVLMVH